MTVTYTSEVTTSRGLSSFIKLLARWRGSIYKLVWVELLCFLLLFYTIKITYEFVPEESQRIFGIAVRYCDKYSNLVPMSFILGFYVSLIMTRWWDQYLSIPFPDNLAIIVGAYIKGEDEKARVIRRTIVRYVCAAFTITLTMLSPRVKKRFPTMDHFVGAGLLTKEEVKIFSDMDNEFPSFSKYWLPLGWAANVVTRARHEGHIRSDIAVATILEQINTMKSKCGGMLDYDWISVPLVYTQVVTLVVYIYFIVSAIGGQYLPTEDDDNYFNQYFPLFLVIEFFFYVGWLKVAEVLINPYGEDDDDFEVVWMVDRHIQVCYLLVDRIHQEHPKLVKDMYWYETVPTYLPFTLASKDYMYEYPFPSTLNVSVRKVDQDIIMPPEDTISQSDGLKSRSSLAYLWRTPGNSITKRNGSHIISLEKVIHFGEQERINDVIDSISSSKSQNVEIDCVEFELLRQKRIEQRRKNIKELMKMSTED